MRQAQQLRALLLVALLLVFVHRVEGLTPGDDAGKAIGAEIRIAIEKGDDAFGLAFGEDLLDRLLETELRAQLHGPAVKSVDGEQGRGRAVAGRCRRQGVRFPVTSDSMR